MIEQDIFLERMSELADRFNRPLHEQTQRRYYELLSRELTTEEFIGAAELAFRNSTYWPSPKELVDYIRPPRDLGLEAAHAFDRVLALGEATPHGTSWRKDRVAEEVGETAAAAFAAIGANGRLRNLTTDDLPWARKEFVAAYKAYAVQSSHELAATEARRLPRYEQQRQLPERATG